MQNHEAFVCQTHEDGDAQWTTGLGDGEQRLHALDVANADAQATVLFVYFRHPIGFDGLLNSQANPMLVHVEKKQMLQGDTLFSGQLRRNPD